jgi:hypothetical protein
MCELCVIVKLTCVMLFLIFLKKELLNFLLLLSSDGS